MKERERGGEIYPSSLLHKDAYLTRDQAFAVATQLAERVIAELEQLNRVGFYLLTEHDGVHVVDPNDYSFDFFEVRTIHINTDKV